MSIDSVVNKINSFLKALDAKLTIVVPMPAIFLLCAAMNRKGLSKLRSLSNICQELEGYGIPTGPNADGSPNLTVLHTHAIMNEVVRMMTEDAVIQGAINPGEMMIVSSGSNGGGGMISTGTNILPTHLWGLVQ